MSSAQDVFQTTFDFVLPRGYVDADGRVPREGTMRLATARDELIPPWTLERMCAAVATRHDDFTVACSPHLATRGLNVGVLAAKDMFGARDEDAMETETAECAYYDREETASVMSPPPSASVLRVEYSAGKYYIPS